MKVLLCHAYYRLRGGEDCCFEEERDYLRANGHDVVEFVRRNDEMTDISALSAAVTTLWNGKAAREMRGLIASHRPEVVHLTNTFPLLSPAVCHAARREGVPVVQALQNYRWMCANGYFMRDGAPCEACLTSRAPWKAIKNRCYRDSAAASAVVVGMQVMHRRLGRWVDKIDAFFTPTKFARERYVEGGFPADRVHVKCNFVDPDPGVGRGDGDYFVFVGRLSPEKGIATVLEAWRQDPALPPLAIIGDGPVAESVRQAAASDSRIRWHGHLPLPEVHRIVGAARALIMSSIWYETFGRTMAEAFAAGTPVIASRLGAMTELVADGRTGWHFNPGDATDLAQKVRHAATLSADETTPMRRSAREAYEAQFTAKANHARLMEIYDAAIRVAGRRGELRAPRMAPKVREATV